MYDTVFFDLDGTLVNSAEGITKGVLYALEQYKMSPLSYPELVKFIGPPIRDSFQRFCGATEAEADLLLAAYRAYYAEKGQYQVEPFDGIHALLERLVQKGKKLYVATAKPTGFSNTILKNLELYGYFEEVIGAGLDKNFETKEKIVALAKSKAASDNIVMVGDTVYDIRGARENGIPTIAVLYGFGDHDAICAEKPQYIAETVEDIERYI